jgi:hypothetical protein
LGKDWERGVGGGAWRRSGRTGKGVSGRVWWRGLAALGKDWEKVWEEGVWGGCGGGRCGIRRRAGKGVLGRVWWRAMRNTEEGWERGVGAGVVAGDAEYGGGLGKGCWGRGLAALGKDWKRGVWGARWQSERIASQHVGKSWEKDVGWVSVAVRTHCVAAPREKLGRGCRGGAWEARGGTWKEVSGRRLGEEIDRSDY